jgi:hypothetical protein
MNRVDRQIEAFAGDAKELLRWLNKLAVENPEALAAALHPTQTALLQNTITRQLLLPDLQAEARAQIELADFHRKNAA